MAATPLNSSAGEQNGTSGLFSRMTGRHQWQETHLDRLSETRTYKVQNEKDKVVAEQVVLMEYIAPDTDTFTSSSEKGSGFVLHHVFRRLMENEKKRVGADKDPDSLITPENYTFEIVGTERIDSSNCSVVHAVPKRKQTDLFEGKIWIDNEDFAIVKISGHLAKSPSFWIKRVDFVRNYQKIDGFWLLSREEAVSAIRMFGKETLTIDYKNYTVNGSAALQSLCSHEFDARADGL
ncbi:MAG: outer membrane lipoprotein-sorting protein [Candidatus Acidiferrales bacterium]